MQPSTPLEPNGINLRQASADDLPILLSILQAAFEEYRDRLDPPSGVHHETTETLAQKMQKGGAFLAFIAEEAVGCVFFEVESDYVYLGRLSVLPQFRNRGVARALINQIEQQASALHIPRLQLGVRMALPQLRDYYARLGFRTVRYGTHEGYSGPTYAIMEKDLGLPQV